VSLLHPAIFALGLAALALPIAVHFLFRRRRRPAPWGAMRFVLEAYRRQRKRLRFEQLLLFSARCLILLLAALALARPILGSADASPAGPVTLYLLVDNSIAGDLREDTAAATPALARHRDRAARLLASLDEARGDRAALIPLAAPAEGVVLPPSPDLGAVGGLVRQLAQLDSAPDLAGAFALVARDAADAGASGPVRVAVLSDLYEGAADTSESLPALPQGVTLLLPDPPASGVPNVSVRSIEALRSVLLTPRRGIDDGALGPGATTQAVVTLDRAAAGAGSAESVRVRLAAEAHAEGDAPLPAVALGEQVARFAPGERSATVAFPVDLGAVPERAREVVLVARIDRDRLPADNVARRVVERREALRVGVVAQPRFGERPPIDRFTPGDWARLALAPESREVSRGRQIETVDIPPGAVDVPRLRGLDAALIAEPAGVDSAGWSALAELAARGGVVLVFPSADPSPQRWLADFERAFSTGLRIDAEPEGPGSFPLAARFEDSAGESDRATPDPFALVRNELPQLVAPVRSERRLRIDPPRREAGVGVRTLWAFASGEPAILTARPGAGADDDLSRARPNAGLVILFAIPLDLGWTDLPARPLVVPLLQESVRQGVGLAAGPRSSIAGRPLALPSSSASVRMLTSEREGSPAPGPVRAGLATHHRAAGTLAALDASGAPLATLAVQPDARGSRTDARPPAEVRAWLASAAGHEDALVSLDAPAGATAREARDPLAGAPLAAALLLAALLLALVEMLAARLASHAALPAEGAP